jgi:hypothetical protein
MCYLNKGTWQVEATYVGMFEKWNNAQVPG